MAAAVAEGVGGGAEAGHRFAGFGEGGDALQLPVGQIAETRVDDHHVGLFEDFQAFDVVGAVGIDDAVGEGEADGDGEAMVAVEDAGEHGHGFLGAVLLVAGDEDDVGPAFLAVQAGDVGGCVGGHGGSGGRKHGGGKKGGLEIRIHE